MICTDPWNLTIILDYLAVGVTESKDSLSRVYKLSPNEDSALSIGNRKRKNKKRISMGKWLRKYGQTWKTNGK